MFTLIGKLRVQYCIPSFAQLEVYTSCTQRQEPGQSKSWCRKVLKRKLAAANSHVTINATANLEGITADILPYVASHWRFVKTWVRHHCRIWRSRPGVSEGPNFLLFADKIEWFALSIIVKLPNICICPTWVNISCRIMSPTYIMIS